MIRSVRPRLDGEAKAAKAAVDAVMYSFMELSQNRKLERDRDLINTYEERLRKLRLERDLFGPRGKRVAEGHADENRRGGGE